MGTEYYLIDRASKSCMNIDKAEWLFSAATPWDGSRQTWIDPPLPVTTEMVETALADPKLWERGQPREIGPKILRWLREVAHGPVEICSTYADDPWETDEERTEWTVYEPRYRWVVGWDAPPEPADWLWGRWPACEEDM